MDHPPRPPPSWWDCRIYDFMWFQERFLLPFELLTEAVILVYASAYILLAYYAVALFFVVTAYALLIVLGVLYLTVGRERDYLVFLASKVIEPLRTPVTLARFEMHLPALRRIGMQLSGGAANSALAVVAPPQGHEKEHRPESFGEVVRAIELRLVDESAPLEGDHRADPFVRYVRDLTHTFGWGPVTLERWRSFLLTRYWSSSKACRKRARKYPLAPPWTWFESVLKEPKLVLAGLPAVLSIVMWLIGHFWK